MKIAMWGVLSLALGCAEVVIDRPVLGQEGGQDASGAGGSDGGAAGAGAAQGGTGVGNKGGQGGSPECFEGAPCPGGEVCIEGECRRPCQGGCELGEGCCVYGVGQGYCEGEDKADCLAWGPQACSCSGPECVCMSPPYLCCESLGFCLQASMSSDFEDYCP